MSKRWIYQIKNGLVWGLIISLCLSVFDLFEMAFEDAFFSKKNLFRTLCFVLVGVFIVGYLSWKKKVKRDDCTELSHNNAVNK